MKMWPLIRGFFAGMGIILTLLILIVFGFYYYFSTYQPEFFSAVLERGTMRESREPYDHPLLSPEQEQLAETFGIDTRTIPTELTPEQQRCVIGELGEARAQEIVAGDAPTVREIFSAKHCFE